MAGKTAFDSYLSDQLKKPRFRVAHSKARREIAAVDQIVRALDAARIDAGLSKAELARAISAKPEIVRRLFTTSSANPTLATVAKLAEALGCKLKLVPTGSDTPITKQRAPRKSTASRKAA